MPGPTDVDAWAWYTADAIAGKNDGDAISQWDDSSGNARHAIQGVGANQPVYKTAIANDLPVVRFDGANDQLEVPSMAALVAGTGFVVVKIDATPPASGQTGLWSFGTGSASHYPFTDGLLYESWGSTVRKDAIALPDVAQWRIYEVYSGPGDWAAYLDGTLLHQTGTNTVGFSAAPRIGTGGDAALDGDIAECVLYDTVLSPDDRVDVRVALNNKYFPRPPLQLRASTRFGPF